MQNIHVVFAEAKLAAHVEKRHPRHAGDFADLEQFRIDDGGERVRTA